MDLKKISVVITCYNEQRNIVRCLRGLEGFGEIMVVDSFSTDGTMEMARRYPTTIYQRPYACAAKQKNWVISLARNDWILVMDADEAVPPELKREIQQLNEESGFEGYWIRRTSEYLGREIRRCGWQRDKVLRLFQKDRGSYEDREVHEEIVLKGEVGFLEARLRHYPYQGIEQHFRKINVYSSRGAKDYIERGGRCPLVNMLFHPPFRFLRMYVFQGGVLDGIQGLVLCLLSSYGVFLKYAKAWEYRKVEKRE